MSPVLNGLFGLNIRDEKNHQNKVNDLLILKNTSAKNYIFTEHAYCESDEETRVYHFNNFEKSII